MLKEIMEQIRDKFYQIRSLALLVCLVIGSGWSLDCLAQSSLSQWTPHFNKNDSTHSLVFQVLPPLDTLSQEGLRWKIQLEGTDQPVFIFLSISGALICFKDSALQHPFLVEKNKRFGFRKWETGKLYKLTVWKCTGPHGFLKIAWFDLATGENLDEIFLCYPFSFRCISEARPIPGPGVKVRIVP